MEIRIIGCALLFLYATPPCLAGEIQKWVDQDGRAHFGDIAPLDADTTQLNPEIITTAPSHKSLKEILRPGERRMLKRYEQRGQRLSKAKRKSLKQDKQKQSKIASAENKCQYNRQKKDELERKLRHGYKPSQKNSIETKIAKARLLIKKYCG
jgi:Domain of unknown function (DUF4124)